MMACSGRAFQATLSCGCHSCLFSIHFGTTMAVTRSAATTSAAEASPSFQAALSWGSDRELVVASKYLAAAK
eukprot:CAMPEP_0169078812 /NCGR_PEP_ID=MMETSP1015-20121227/9612_1 /TAXON_ID=342587 /ORGANISM="Karlodinium micrum, Strain CCMP2283" /LENGTH=71 /DNA_ID=CAMNT_0009138429 /DNA_START=708 /DNA_END=924 /DNA_ORIENTATION=-